VSEAGTYKFCVMIADIVFEKYDKVKSLVRFNTEFHKSKMQFAHLLEKREEKKVVTTKGDDG